MKVFSVWLTAAMFMMTGSASASLVDVTLVLEPNELSSGQPWSDSELTIEFLLDTEDSRSSAVGVLQVWLLIATTATFEGQTYEFKRFQQVLDRFDAGVTSISLFGSGDQFRFYGSLIFDQELERPFPLTYNSESQGETRPYARFNTSFGASTGTQPPACRAQPFADCGITFVGKSISIAPVPLPASAWLLLAGLGGLGVMRGRKRGI